MICDEIDQPGEKVVAQTEVGELLIMMKTCMDLAAEKKSKGTKVMSLSSGHDYIISRKTVSCIFLMISLSQRKSTHSMGSMLNFNTRVPLSVTGSRPIWSVDILFDAPI
jgi:hypothetical protein